ncbi:hypothetical protein V5799_033060 [Amblyomma americanum]|uniref:Cytochrome n=1 Tax=Amblyomma americanum TaxID=6943 RepID=A0AAQ4DPE1_AMBAM
MYFPSILAFFPWPFIIITIGFLLYSRAARYRNYWKDQGVPHEKFSLLFGAQMKHLFTPLHLADEELYKKHGRLFGSFEDGKPVLFVGDPDLIKVALVKDGAKNQRRIFKYDDPILANLMLNVEPEQWRRIRSATSAAFTSGKLRKMQETIDKCALHMAERLKEVAKRSEDVNTKGYYGYFAFEAVSRCSFGARFSPKSDEERAFVRSARHAFFTPVTPWIVLTAFFQRLGESFHKARFNKYSFSFYRDATTEMIKQRAESNTRHEDFLQMMLNAQEVSKEDVTKADQENSSPDFESSPLKPKDVKNLSEEEALAQCVLFFLAGQDTSSATSSFASYFLAINPDIQDKLRAEVDECFRKHGSSPPYDEVQKLPYLDCVVNETLRIMPTTVRLERTPFEDYVLGDTGVKVLRDCAIIVPVTAIHNDPEFFPDPEIFNPDRFNKENINSIRPYTFLPFGAGPRHCMGKRFAFQLVKTCLLHAVHSVEFVKCPRTKVPLEYLPGFGLLVPKELIVGIRERSRPVAD